MYKRKLFHVCLLGLMFAISLFIGRNLPSTIPIHWDSSNTINRYGSKYELLLLLPIITSILYIISIPIERLIKPQSAKIVNMIAFFRIYLILLFGLMHILIVKIVINKIM